MSGSTSAARAIQASDLSVSFGLRPILAEISFELSRGEIVAVVGSSGAGKSTLLSVLAGLRRPSSGRVILDGVNLGAMSSRDRDRFRRKSIGHVFQFGELVAELTLVENVALPLRLLGEKRHAALQLAETRLAELGVDHLAGKYPEEVSGGEMQRAAICRSLVHGPSVVLADEPTGSLDTATGRTVFDLLVRECREHQVGCLVVTHEEWLAERCDRTLRLQEGRLSSQ